MIEQLNNEESNEEAVREQHRQRIEQMRRSKEKQMAFRRNFKRFAPIVTCVVVVAVMLLLRAQLFYKSLGSSQKEAQVSSMAGSEPISFGKIIDDDSVREDAASKEESPIPQGEGASEGAVDPVGKGQEVPGENSGISFGLSEAATLLKENSKVVIHKAKADADTVKLGEQLASGDEFFSQNAVLIDTGRETILAEKGYNIRINPASMTKILTVLVAAEHVEDLDDKFTITLEITDYGYTHDCSSAGFVKDEEVTVRDLFYGTILPSGADAAVGLATYVAGSQEAFVEMMNAKLKELGLSETTHFTNCVGVYEEDHYSTVYDIAMILEAAIDNEMCREFLTAHTYTTSRTEQHPEGIELSNWFLRRIEDKDSGGEVLYAKTGYVNESGSCAASYAVDGSGKAYVCVTVGANSPWRCIYDHFRLYKQFFDS